VKLKAYLGVAVFFVTALPSQAEITGEPQRYPEIPSGATLCLRQRLHFEAVRRRTGGPEKSPGQVPDIRSGRMDVGSGAFRVLETYLTDAKT
jgi:hypothetical protein